MAHKVGSRETGVSSAESRVLATFLMEMDGITSTPGEGIIVLAATNRLDAVSSSFTLLIFADRAGLSVEVYSTITAIILFCGGGRLRVV